MSDLGGSGEHSTSAKKGLYSTVDDPSQSGQLVNPKMEGCFLASTIGRRPGYHQTSSDDDHVV